MQAIESSEDDWYAVSSLCLSSVSQPYKSPSGAARVYDSTQQIVSELVLECTPSTARLMRFG